jgi:hypothetical protein
MVDVPVPTASPVPRWGPRQRLVALTVVLLGVLAVVAWIERDEGPGRPPGSWTQVPYEGLGAWVDAYDWTTGLGGDTPTVDADDMEAIADTGVQTLFLQTAHARLGSGIPERERLEDLIDAAHEAGMHVVAWYLPTLVDVDADLELLVAQAELDVDGLAVDLEATDVEDVAERTARLVDLSQRLRAAMDDIDRDRPIGAITLSAVHVQVVNPAFWPGYPWAEIGATYDVVLPMAYWTIRTGELRAGDRYTAENVDRVRASTGRPDMPIHVIGGIADGATEADLSAMVDVLRAREAIGGSLYDWSTSNEAQWLVLAPLADLRTVR